MTYQVAKSTAGLLTFETIPAFCPNTLTTVVVGDAYLVEVQVALASSASGPATVKVQDIQGTPVHAASVTLNPGDVQGFLFHSRFMKGGISVISDTAAVVATYLKWQQ